MKKRGRIFVVSSPSGGGKTTICNSLKKEGFNIKYSVSATTRQPRPNEKDGHDYRFLKREEFERLASEGKFLEWADNYGDLYGTPRDFIEETIAGGDNIILSIDVKGAMQVREISKDAVLVFLLPPSIELLEKRLKDRRTEDSKTTARRLEVAKKELECADKYDYRIVNDSLPKAVSALKSIIMKESR